MAKMANFSGLRPVILHMSVSVLAHPLIRPVGVSQGTSTLQSRDVPTAQAHCQVADG